MRDDAPTADRTVRRASGLKEQFVLPHERCGRAWLGSRAWVEARLRHCLIMVMRLQIDNGGVDLARIAIDRI